MLEELSSVFCVWLQWVLAVSCRGREEASCLSHPARCTLLASQSRPCTHQAVFKFPSTPLHLEASCEMVNLFPGAAVIECHKLGG